ncbi:FG-GAP-like repeat-containing protein [Rubripirellula reticaptiva]|uniref:FG-GAP repeat protein n=1 Tax=Rubripirellula reticaptiva TaxID=2528013 RepID=A0A5C6EH60_9BACT|nr:FG-GAP-like repeat-containing protein [Rubripirellula reticaptiva]TWU48332.1 FG-GAP repeat protein [Rubripirellula reticaptiva]
MTCLWVPILAGCQTESKPVTKTASAKISRPGGVERQEKTTATDGADMASLDVLISKGEASFLKGDFQAAEQHYRTAALMDASRADVLFALAQTKWQLGDTDHAIKLIADIPADDAHWGFAARGQMADWLMQTSQTQKAVVVYRELIEARPDFTPLRHRLVSALNSIGFRAAAAKVLMPLVKEKQASEDELRTLLNLSRPADFAQRQPEPFDETSATVDSMRLTLTRFDRSELRDAADWQQQVIDAAPDNPEAAAWMLWLRAQLMQWDQWTLAMQTLPSGTQDYAMFWLAAGDYEISKDRHESAVRCYLESMRRDDTVVETHQRLTAALLVLGQPDVAQAFDERRFAQTDTIEAGKAIGKQQPDDRVAGEAIVRDMIRFGRMDQAAAWYRVLASRHPESRNEVIESRLRVPLDEPEYEQAKFCGLSAENFALPEWIDEDRKIAVDSFGPPTLLGPKTSDENASPRISRPIAATMVEVAAERGIHFQYRNHSTHRTKFMRIHESLVGGVAAFDFDRDGRIDLYFNQGAGIPPSKPGILPNQLYRNLGSVFELVTDLAATDDRGYSLGVTAGDLNQDGWPDLVVANLGTNRVFINQGDGTFRDEASHNQNRQITETFTTSIGIADVTGDSLPDLVSVRYVTDPKIFQEVEVGPDGVALRFPGPLQFTPAVDSVAVCKPTGERTIVDLGQTKSNGIAMVGEAAQPGLGLMISDFDGKPGAEFFVANDQRPNQLWKFVSPENDGIPVSGESPFTDIAVAMGTALNLHGRATACMGIAWADFDNVNGDDLMVTNWYNEWINAYRSGPVAGFRDDPIRFGLDVLSEKRVGFGIQPIDFDNDGWNDLIIGNGHIEDLSHTGTAFAMPTQLLANQNGHFVDAHPTESATVDATHNDYWSTLHHGRCVITCDFNQDGRMDAVISDLNGPAAVIENQTVTPNHFLQIELVGRSVERDAVATIIQVTSGPTKLRHATATGDGYEGKNETVTHFGLGSASDRVDVTVTWPNGQADEYKQLSVDHRWLITEGDPEAWQLR